MLNKVNYVDGTTVIHAKNLNDIQDAIVKLESSPAGGGVQSVNSKTPDDKGNVTITAADVRAIPNEANAVTPSLLDRAYAEIGANGKVKPELIAAVINEYNESHVLEAKDAGAEVLMYCATPMTVTIPTQDTVNFPQWTEIEIIRFGTADLTIAGAEGVTIFSAGNKRQIGEMYDVVSLKKTYMNNWLLVGNLK